ncbi:MAG: helix-turn-helix domain-containing protein [bacterium]|nr:helix-turn-helix domain-containing protein [bacterium]
MAEFTTNAAVMRDELAPLYRRYPGQTKPQPAYIEIDPSTWTVTATHDGEIGGAVPMAVWHGLYRRIPVDPYLRGRVVADMLEDPELQTLIGRICAGHSIEWDGNNRVGRLSEDAQQALQDAIEWVDSYIDDPTDRVAVYDAGEWLRGSPPPVTATSTDEEITQWDREIEEEARREGVILEGSVAEYLRALRDELGYKADMERPEPPPMLDVATVASRLSVDRQTVLREIKRGHLRAHKIGVQWRIPQEALDDYLDQTAVRPTEKGDPA